MRTLCLGMLVSILILNAQETEEQPEIAPAPKPNRWRVLSHQEIAYNHFMGAPDTLRGSVEGLGSIKLNISWLPALRMGSFYIGMGGGIAIREVRFEKPVTLFRLSNEQVGYIVDSLPDDVRAKSKFQLGYLRIPLEIGILKRRFNFAIFGYGEALLWVKHKRKYREDNDQARFVSYGNRLYHTDGLQYGVGARLGYRGIGLFATYNLSPLWSRNRGPSDVHMLQAGIYFFQSASIKSDKSSKNKSKTSYTSYY
ncbi:MAG: hypothetical protein NZZ60_01730 [Bacteroidia bacterium]|nr:hypothetical protein [Bacteroidia bacterium]MCX7651428.1 hypothetical protein [Bacteroidia bacterium]MDW8417063.1 hypothetical protein [Bacteroidia bacterium]